MGFVINASSECFFALTSVSISGFFYRKVTQTQFYFLLLIIFQTRPGFKQLPGFNSLNIGFTLVRNGLLLRLTWKIDIQGADTLKEVKLFVLLSRPEGCT